MQFNDSTENIQLNASWLAIGTFDGIHLGHQKILSELVIGANQAGYPTVVITFHPHPATILHNRSGRFYLTSPQERENLIRSCGVDFVHIYHFDRITSRTSAIDFLIGIHKQIHMKQLVVGHDFALGKDREGDLDELIRIGKKLRYQVEKFGPFRLDGDIVSSSAIRKHLVEGKIKITNRMLDRPFKVDGIVVPGDGRGREIGIPTANLDVWKEHILPKPGVYLNQVNLDGNLLPAVTNIGVRPTFDGEELRIETHLIDFQGDLYGRNLSLFFLDRLRDEVKFSSVQHLVTQIQSDILQAKLLYATQD